MSLEDLCGGWDGAKAPIADDRGDGTLEEGSDDLSVERILLDEVEAFWRRLDELDEAGAISYSNEQANALSNLLGHYWAGLRSSIEDKGGEVD